MTQTHFGNARIELNEKQGKVDEVFHAVAGRYDLMNDMMSGGMHRIWKDAFVAQLNPPKSDRQFLHLDMAGGTGDISFRVADAGGSGCKSIVCDINQSMLDVGADRAQAKGYADKVSFQCENAEKLPFDDRTFDAYTIAFGIRNVPRIDVALAEAHRVLKTGGHFMCLEFSEVDVPVLDKIYDLFSFNVIPPMGRMVTGDAAPYQYLVESIRQFPNQVRFKRMIEQAGFKRVSYRNLSGGIAAIHSGWKY